MLVVVQPFSDIFLFCFLITTTVMITEATLVAVMAPVANSPPTAPSITDSESEVADRGVMSDRELGTADVVISVFVRNTSDCELEIVDDSDNVKPVMVCCMHMIINRSRSVAIITSSPGHSQFFNHGYTQRNLGMRLSLRVLNFCM